MNEHFDVIVIGSAPGGASLAQAFGPTGRRILILERGDYLPASKPTGARKRFSLTANTKPPRPGSTPREGPSARSFIVSGAAHQAGTLRFGVDPATSVLDLACRAHEVDNLYVTNCGFFLSIGAVNPTLTIIANALRVADIIKARL